VKDGTVSTPRRLGFTANIPPFPKAVQRVMSMLRDHSIQLTKVAEVVALDQGLSGKVLRMANSAYFGLPRRVYSVTEALVLLGFANVRSVLISASVGNILCHELEAYGLEAGKLWEHSVGTAYACQIFARRIDARIYSMAFSAGLLHDVGKVAINQVLDPDMRSALVEGLDAAQGPTGPGRPGDHPRHGETGLDSVRRKKDGVETEIAGATHAEAGSEVCRKWNLPEEIVDAAEFHHHHSGAGAHANLAAIVAMADHCSNLIAAGRTVVAPSDLAWLSGSVTSPDQALLTKLTEDLPGMISYSRQLIEGIQAGS
jgi:putative nucleotidyltransferase with HDIG domain